MNLEGLLVIFGCLLVGEVVVRLTHLPLPSSIVGLLVLLVLLNVFEGILPKVSAIAHTFLAYLAFMIVPACVSIVEHLPVLKQDGLALLIGTALSTLLVLFATAKTHSVVRNLSQKYTQNRSKQ